MALFLPAWIRNSNPQTKGMPRLCQCVTIKNRAKSREINRVFLQKL
jgi:hypothetical protein